MQMYVLDGKTPVVEKDPIVWSKFSDNSSAKRVGLTPVGPVTVSTVFLGLDHQYGDGPPMLFETMAFRGDYEDWEEYQTRCSTWEEAERMHQDAVEYFKERYKDHKDEDDK